MKKDCAVASEVFFVGGEMGWEGVGVRCNKINFKSLARRKLKH